LDFAGRAQAESMGTIEDSEKLALFLSLDHSQKVSKAHRHYYIRTYDTVFEIISPQFSLSVKT
jgi:hypothetical protein